MFMTNFGLVNSWQHLSHKTIFCVHTHDYQMKNWIKRDQKLKITKTLPRKLKQECCFGLTPVFHTCLQENVKNKLENEFTALS